MQFIVRTGSVEWDFGGFTAAWARRFTADADRNTAGGHSSDVSMCVCACVCVCRSTLKERPLTHTHPYTDTCMHTHIIVLPVMRCPISQHHWIAVWSTAGGPWHPPLPTKLSLPILWVCVGVCVLYAQEKEGVLECMVCMCVCVCALMPHECAMRECQACTDRVNACVCVCVCV